MRQKVTSPRKKGPHYHFLSPVSCLCTKIKCFQTAAQKGLHSSQYSWLYFQTTMYTDQKVSIVIKASPAPMRTRWGQGSGSGWGFVVMLITPKSKQSEEKNIVGDSMSVQLAIQYSPAYNYCVHTQDAHTFCIHPHWSTIYQSEQWFVFLFLDNAGIITV